MNLDKVYKDGVIVYPPRSQVYRAFELCSLEDLSVVILGQDPYHGPNQANGLAFSVNKGEKLPPSLQNIFKELHDDLGIPIPRTGNLTSWAKQGVLLLNALLTVRANEASSHRNIGWEIFTNSVIKKISDEKTGIVFLLWGKYAQEKEFLIDTSKHFILKAAHPSPFSAASGFFGSKHFSKTNEILKREGKEPINWKIE